MVLFCRDSLGLTNLDRTPNIVLRGNLHPEINEKIGNPVTCSINVVLAMACTHSVFQWPFFLVLLGYRSGSLCGMWERCRALCWYFLVFMIMIVPRFLFSFRAMLGLVSLTFGYLQYLLQWFFWTYHPLVFCVRNPFGCLDRGELTPLLRRLPFEFVSYLI